MAEENQLQIEIVLDDGSVQKGFAKIQSEGEKSAKGLSKAFSINGFADLGAFILIANKGLSLFKESVSDGIKEAIDGEQASLRLGTALKSVAGVTDEAVKSFKDFTSTLASQSAIDDDVINSNAAVLASIGRLKGEGLEAATKAALDLSAGLGISLETAFQQVAKAATGNTTAFQKLGFEFTKGASDAKILDQALNQINQRFGGLAKTQADNTFTGVVNRLKVAFDDSNQALGEIITKSPAIREVFKFIADAFNSSTNAIKEFGASGGIDRLILGLVEFARSVNTFLITPLELFLNLGKGVFDAVILSINGVIAAVGNLGGTIGFLISKVTGDNSLTKALETFKQSSSDVFTESAAGFKGFADVLNTPLSDTIGTGIDSLSTRIANAKPVVDATTLSLTNQKEEVKQLTDAIYSGIIANESFASSGQAIVAAFSQISGQFKAAALDIGITAKSIAKTILTSVGTGAANAFAAFGKAVAEGENALDAFVNSLLASLGQMAVQVGSQFILQGIAYSLAGLPNGPALIGAGAALAAFGGILSSVGGKSASPVASVATGGGITPTEGGIDFSNGEEINNTVEARAPRSEVIVNVNGDILGDESSGRKIVELINSAFDASGVNLRTGIV